MVKEKKKSSTTLFIEEIGLEPEKEYKYLEVLSKAEEKGISNSDAEKHIDNARKLGKIIKYPHNSKGIVIKLRGSRISDPKTIKKRRMKILKIWMHREFEWINHKKILDIAEENRIDRRTTDRDLKYFDNEKILERKEFKVYGRENTFYRPTYFFYEYSRAAPIVMLEKSHNTITVPIDPYIWITLHNFPDISYLKPEYGNRLKEGLKCIEKGLNIISEIRAKNISEYHEFVIKIKKTRKLTKKEEEFDKEMNKKSIASPFVLTGCTLGHYIYKMDYPYIEAQAYTLYYFLHKYLRFEADLFQGASWDLGKGLSGDEINEKLKEKKLSNLVNRVRRLYRECLFRMWRYEVNELKKELDLLEDLKNEIEKSGITESDEGNYIKRLVQIKNLPKGYRTYGRTRRNKRFNEVINKFQEADIKEKPSNLLIEYFEDKLIKPAIEEKKQFENELEEIRNTSDDPIDLDRLAFKFNCVIPPSLQELEEMGILRPLYFETHE